MQNVIAILIALFLLAAGFVMGQYATPAPKPVIPAPKEDPFPPRQQQTRMPESVVDPTPVREPVMQLLLDAFEESEPPARITRLAVLLPALGPDAIAEIHAALDDYALDLNAAEIDLLVRFWASHDPRGATTWASIGAPGIYSDVAITAALETWAGIDPGSASDHLDAMRLLPGRSVRVFEVALIRGWFRSGLPGLEEYVESLEMGDERQRAIGIYARKVIQRDGPAAVVRWAESVPTDDKARKLDVNRYVVRELVKVDPAVAVAFCDAHCDGGFGSSMRMLIAQNWAERDGLAAMQWVESQPPGEERDWAVNGAFRGWTRRKPEEFKAWLAGIEPENVAPWLQPVLEVMPRWLASEDPEAAIRWASVIEEPERRERVLIIIARRWRGMDVAAAEAWLAQSPLSESARAQVLDPNPPVPERKLATDAMKELEGTGPAASEGMEGPAE